MSSEWDRKAELYELARKLPDSEWDRYLSDQQVEEKLRLELLHMLHTTPPEGDPLEGSAGEWLGQAIGPDRPRVARLQAGSILGGRFRIIRLLGRGGMGEVFEAHDAELGVDVAVKLLDPDLERAKGFAERFRREITLARRISHPNVAKVFDYLPAAPSADGPLNVYVMELLAGETLAARLRRDGALDPREALALATQVASGLDAAHEAGVLHRDLKPANIMLTGARAVITDFGLAVAMEPDGRAELRTTSLMMGTPGYMAPEQWVGQPATRQSDVYAFGVILHELITGEHPNAKKAERGAPEPWRRAIAQCLAIDPASRFSSAGAAVRAVSRPFALRRNVILGAGSAMLMSLGAVGWRYSRQASPMPKVTRLLLTPVQNTTGDPRFDGATALLYGQLNQSPQLQLISPERQAAARKLMGLAPGVAMTPAQARDMAWRNKTPAVLYSSVASVGPEFVLNLTMETLNGRPDSIGASAAQAFRAGGAEDLMQRFRAAATWARGVAGEAAKQIADTDRPPADVTTGNWLALAHYQSALTFRREARYETAVQHLKDALAVDPQFTSASRELADLWIQLHKYEDGFRQWASAMELLAKTNVTTRERYLAESLYFGDIFEFPKAMEASRAWSIHYPEDAGAFFHYASYLAMLDRFDEAGANFERAWALEPTPAAARWQVVIGWLRGDDQQSDDALGRLKAAEGRGQYLRSLGQTQYLRGQIGEAEATFRGLSGHGEVVQADFGFAFLTCLLAETGRWGEALETARAHVAMLRRSANAQTLARRLLQMSFLLARAGRAAEAIPPAEESWGLEKGPRHAIRVATMFRVLGRLDGLREMVDGTAGWPRLRIFDVAREWVEMEHSNLQKKVFSEARVRAILSGIPESLIPAELAIGVVQAELPRTAFVKRWYMADHHWPGMMSGQFVMNR